MQRRSHDRAIKHRSEKSGSAIGRNDSRFAVSSCALIKCAIDCSHRCNFGRWLITVVKGGHNLLKYRKCITMASLAMSHSVKVLPRGS